MRGIKLLGKISKDILLKLAELGEAQFRVFWDTPYKGSSPKDFYNSLTRLFEHGYIKRKNSHLGIYILSKKGKKAIDLIQDTFQKSFLAIKKWNRKWHIVIFDIPEEIRYNRDMLRKLLIDFGFKRLQNSVWVTPHPIPAEFKEIMKENDLHSYIRYLVVDEINDSQDLLDYFNLQN